MNYRNYHIKLGRFEGDLNFKTVYRILLMGVFLVLRARIYIIELGSVVYFGSW
ncbi:hypothetical protein MCGE09_00174 [Thaumarchaeota archaeon SCGC AB-539-E09]|nr:hypothetical protein MCGE09_00174 [Thaumarchaeota archaeon SCGC AB-539-E09]